MAWIIQNNELTNTNFVNPLSNELFKGDSPAMFWKSDPNINDGIAYNKFMVWYPDLQTPAGPYFGTKNIISMYLGDEPVIALK